MTEQPFFFPALFIGLMSIPLIFALVPPNRFYGLRTAKTIANDKLWYKANKLGGWLFLIASTVYLAFAAFHPLARIHDVQFSLWLVHLFIFAVPLLVSIMCIIRYLRRF